MNTEKLKVPLREDGTCGLDFGKDYGRKRSGKITTIIGACFLAGLIISMFVTIIVTLSRVNNLENEVQSLKIFLNSVKALDEDFLNAVVGYEDEDDFGEEDDFSKEDADSRMAPELFIGKTEDSGEYFDYENYDEKNDTDDGIGSGRKHDALGTVKLAADFTKQGLETLRKKRNIVAATDDGVVINSESYAERKAKNGTRRSHPLTPLAAHPSSFGSASWSSPEYDSNRYSVTPAYRSSHVKHSTKAPPVLTRKSRVMHHEDRSKAFRQVIKKSSLKSGDSLLDSNEETTSSDPQFTIVRDEGLGRRRYRQRHLNLETLDERHPRVGRIKPLPSAHYSGDTSRYVVGTHTNFNGNGHLRHPQRTFVDWKASDWMATTGMDSHFTMEDGVLAIKEPGLYFVYAQVYYLDEHDTTGFRVYKNGETILQCTITAHSSERILKGNTCYTAGAEYLSEGDRVSLADVTDGRYSLFEPGKSFFGIIKLGDIKIK